MDYFAASFKDKVGIVSGAGAGQGKAVVKLLLENGARVVAFSRSGNKPDVKHENLTIFKGDSTSIESLNEVRNEVEGRHGKINFLYNNHGMFSPSHKEFDPEKVMEFFRGNVVSSINSIRVFVPIMQSGGSIVSVGASPALLNLSSLEYAVSKYSVEEMTRKAAAMLRERNIRVNSIQPGSVDSSREIEDLKPFGFKKLKDKKEVSTLEVAYLALFLLSDLSYGINGQSIAIDGGVRLR